jgi:hypothetical protein
MDLHPYDTECHDTTRHDTMLLVGFHQKFIYSLVKKINFKSMHMYWKKTHDKFNVLKQISFNEL